MGRNILYLLAVESITISETIANSNIQLENGNILGDILKKEVRERAVVRVETAVHGDVAGSSRKEDSDVVPSLEYAGNASEWVRLLTITFATVSRCQGGPTTVKDDDDRDIIAFADSEEAVDNSIEAHKVVRRENSFQVSFSINGNHIDLSTF